MKNLFKTLKMDQKWPKMTLKWHQMTFEWPWDKKQLHYYIFQEKIMKSCRAVRPLNPIILLLLMKTLF